MDARWIVVKRLVVALRRVVDQIDYGVPPLDNFENEIFKLRWCADEIERQVNEIRKEERASNIRLVFGSTTGRILE